MQVGAEWTTPGVTTALTSLTYVFGPLWAGISYDYLMPSAPYWSDALLLAITWLLIASKVPVSLMNRGDHARTT